MLKQILLAVVLAFTMTLTLWLVAGFQGDVMMIALGLAVALVGSAVVTGAMTVSFGDRRKERS